MKRFERAITYGTFDLFHFGHVEILRGISERAESVFVGVSTDDFNRKKGKDSVIPFEQRFKIIESIRYVDYVFAEDSWDQKQFDIMTYEADLFVMGDDWEGKFDHLAQFCTVLYLPRTPGVSSSEIRGAK